MKYAVIYETGPGGEVVPEPSSLAEMLEVATGF